MFLVLFGPNLERCPLIFGMVPSFTTTVEIILPILPESAEPPPGEVWSSEECRLWAELWTEEGAAFFHYNSTSEECRLYRTLHAECKAVGGPKEAPSFDQCESTSTTKATTAETSATTTASTTTSTSKTTVATTVPSTAIVTTTKTSTTAATTPVPTKPNGRMQLVKIAIR